MVLGWISMRWTASNRSLIAVLLVSVLTVSLRIYHSFPDYSFSSPSHVLLIPDPLFEIDIDLDLASSLDSSDREPDVRARPAYHSRPLGAHTVNPDGLLVVNPDAPHPIFQLIHDAEVAWEAKLSRASKTLDEAVAEYKRRYGRVPPLGFDKWWDYVVEHDVQLPDEYDEIFEDLEHFWGIDPAELAHTQGELEKKSGVVTVQKTGSDSRLEVVGSTLPPERQNLQHSVKNILALMHPVEQNLPALRITFSPFDNPGMLSNWQIKNMALEAAANGTTLTRADMPPVTESGWIQACPPNSPARLDPPMFSSMPGTPSLPFSSPKSFIANHRDTMNPCMHPSLFTSHGQFLSHREGPFPERTLVPRFSLCGTLVHHDIRPPVPYGWDFDSDSGPEDGAFEGDVPWDHKFGERLSWRGRTTGMYASADTPWAYGHRARLVTLANALEGNASVLRVLKTAGRGEAIPVGEPETMRLARVNPAWMDISFTDGAIGCDIDGGTCEEMEALWEFRRVQGRHEEGRHKFILDVDGNGWSGRFKRLMTSNALIFKATIYPEWYTSRIAPWVHYVPIQMSYTDLYDTVSFFRVHDALAAQIAKAGRDWSRKFWRREDMTAYLYRLLLEYARVSSLDRTSMDYVG